MLNVTDTFKKKMKVYGKQINILLEFEDTKLNKNKVIKLEQDINGELFTSVMRLITLEVEKSTTVDESEMLLVNDISKRSIQALNNTKLKFLMSKSENDKKIIDAAEINIKLGVKVDEDTEYEYVDYGKFVVYEFNNCVDTKSYKLTLYDHLIDTHIKYEDSPLELDYSTNKITVGKLLQAICNKFGFTNKTPIFTNSNKIIYEDKYAGLDVTYRDILDEIASVSGGFIKIFNKDLYVAYPTETNEIIDENDLETLNLGKHIGPFNTLVLARSPQEDNIYYPTTISKEDRIAIRIENNQIMDKNREDFIVDLYNRVNGLEYDAFEYKCFGFGYYEFGDIVTLKDLNGKEYKTILLNIIDDINSGISGKAYSEETEFAETKYEYAKSIEKRIRNTEIICDKQNERIKLLVEETSSHEDLISQIQLDITGITETVNQHTTDISNVKNDAVKEAIKSAEGVFDIKIADYPTTVDVETKIETKAGEIEKSLTASIKSDLTGVMDTKLKSYITNTSLNNTLKSYITNTAINTKLLNYSTTTEMQNYVKESVDGVESSITKTVTNNIKIELNDYEKTSDVNAKLLNYSTTTEMQNYVKETSDSYERTIRENFSEKLEEYALSGELKGVQEIVKRNSSTIEQHTTDIALKLDSSSFTSAAVIGLINNKGSSVAKISADVINLSGYLTISSANSTYATTSGLSGGTTAINGSCIKTGTIKAERIDMTSNGALSNGIYVKSPAWLSGGVPSPSGDNNNPIVYFGAFNTSGMNNPLASVGMEIWENGEVYIRRLYCESGAGTGTYMGYIKTSLSNSGDSINYITTTSSKIGVATYSQGAHDIYFAVSDENFKKNIENTKVTAMDYINKIRHIEFNWKEDGKYQQLGFSAQQLKTVCEDFVDSVKQPDDYELDEILQVRDFNILPYMSKGLQEHHVDIKNIFKRLDIIEKIVLKGEI